jgi:hypothetical protein
MSDLKIDLDSECVWLEERWFKKDDLVAAIKGKLEAGDFAVTGLSQALEQLDQSVRNARVLAFRVPAEICDALTVHAQQTGVPVGALLRHAVAQLLLQAHAAPPSAAPLDTATGVEHIHEPPTPEESASAVPLRPKTLPSGAATTTESEKSWFRNAP